MADQHPAHDQACQPRLWLTRDPAECAFPVDGIGADTRSCCRPKASRTPYCPDHRAVMRGPHAPGYVSLLREFARFLA